MSVGGRSGEGEVWDEQREPCKGQLWGALGMLLLVQGLAGPGSSIK